MTALDVNGRPAGLTVNSFASVSLDPPLILWSLRGDSGIIPAFQASPGFIVNVLASHQAESAPRGGPRSAGV
jgi:flavin reductase (DIM6/NTAB) family NADH-FMN oxidoreductase RutF